MSWFRSKDTESPFVKVDQHKTALADARGRIASLDAAHKEIRAEFDELTAEAGRVSAASANLGDDIAWLLGKL